MFPGRSELALRDFPGETDCGSVPDIWSSCGVIECDSESESLCLIRLLAHCSASTRSSLPSSHDTWQPVGWLILAAAPVDARRTRRLAKNETRERSKPLRQDGRWVWSLRALGIGRADTALPLSLKNFILLPILCFRMKTSAKRIAVLVDLDKRKTKEKDLLPSPALAQSKYLASRKIQGYYSRIVLCSRSFSEFRQSQSAHARRDPPCHLATGYLSPP